MKTIKAAFMMTLLLSNLTASTYPVNGKPTGKSHQSFRYKIPAFQARVPGPGGSRPSGGGNSWSLVNNKCASSASGSSLATAAFTNPLTNGSIIVVGVTADNSAGFGITDTAGNTYVDSGAGQLTWSAIFSQVFYVVNSHTTSSNVVTFSIGTTANFPRMCAAEWTNTAGIPASPVDGGTGVGFSSLSSTGGAAGANSLVATPITTVTSGDLITPWFTELNGTLNAGTTLPWIAANQSGAIAEMLEYLQQASAGSITATAGDTSSSDPFGAIVVAFKHN